MAVSSLKGCWYKISARIRDYIDVVDSYYRPSDETSDQSKFNNHNHHHHHRHGHNCDKLNSKDRGVCAKTSSRQHNHNTHTCFDHRQQTPSEYPNVHQNNSRTLPSSSYSKRKTVDGKVYFVDANGQKYWYDPSVPKELLKASFKLDLDGLVGKLSSNWEVKQTLSGKIYYVDHLRRTTQFTDPRLVAYKNRLMSYLKTSKSATTHSNRITNTQISSCQTDCTSNEHANYNNSNPLHQNNSSMSGNSSTSPIAQTITSPRSRCHHKSCSSNYQTRSGRQSGHPDINSSKIRENSRASCNSALSPSIRRHVDINQMPLRNQYSDMMRGSLHNLNTQTQVVNVSDRSSTLTRSPLSSLEQQALRRNLRQNLVNNNCHYDISSLRRDCPTNGTSSHRIQQSELPSNYYNATSFEPNTIASEITCDNSKNLCDKISILRQELLKQQVLNHPCRVDISRKRIFEESFRVISSLQPMDLKKRLLVKFKGEEGLDYGGVAREWFYLLSRKMLNPMHGLFQYTSHDTYNLQINPDSGIVYREHLSYMNFCGRIIGMAVFHGHFIEGHFTRPFYKMLLRRPITLEDIENVDPELHRSLCWILENDITNVIDTTFLVQHNALGQLQEHELKENGRNIAVTEENKHEYVSLYVNYRCRRGIERQSEALQRGFYELISPCLIENFNEFELELLVGGLSKIDIEDWRLNTKLKNCTVETPLVKWFWDVVRSYNEDKRARLLQFVTGSPRVPIQGFKALQGVNSECRLFTLHLIKNACSDNLPKSHTCFNRIDLPPYESYEKLRDKLTQAIEETMGFAMQ